MMYGFGPAMAGFGILGGLLWLVVFIDLVLVGVWLWKQISKNQ